MMIVIEKNNYFQITFSMKERGLVLGSLVFLPIFLGLLSIPIMKNTLAFLFWNLVGSNSCLSFIQKALMELAQP